MPLRSRRAVIISVFIIAIVSLIIVYNKIKPGRADGEALAVYFNIGQGDAAAFITNNICIVIDAGPDDSEDKLTTYLKRYDVDHIDCAVFSHPHDDHIGGADAVLKSFEVSSVLMPDEISGLRVYDEMMRAIDDEECTVYEAVPGLIKEFGDVKLTVLAPCGEYDDLNLSCAVVMISYGDTDFLYMGDCEGGAVDDAIAMMGDEAFDCDVIKIGHHGAASATKEKLLSAATPEIAVISCGAGNDYSHPHESTLSILSTHGISVYRTDINGTVIIKSNGSSVEYMH